MNFIKIIRLVKPLCCAGCGAILFCAQINVSHAQGTLLGPGTSIPAPAATDPVGALSLLDTITTSFSSGSFGGDLISSVYSGDTNNPNGSEDLTFTYELLITNGPDSASAVTIGPFAGFTTYVNYQTPTIGLAPGLISRGPTGSQAVKFDFSTVGYLSSGANSALLVIETDATDWTFGNATILDSTGSPNVTTLVPVPEPTSLGVITLSLTILAGYRRWKK